MYKLAKIKAEIYFEIIYLDCSVKTKFIILNLSQKLNQSRFHPQKFRLLHNLNFFILYKLILRDRVTNFYKFGKKKKKNSIIER